MQRSFSDIEYAAKKKITRRDRFHCEIDAMTPWPALLAEVEPLYPKGEACGHPPIGLARMLRMYIFQHYFGLSDEGTEDALYDSQAIHGFVDIELGREVAPEATTLLKFRHRQVPLQLAERIFAAVNVHLAARGLILREGTVVDAVIIAAPSSTKSQDGLRDPEMYQTKKGNQWHFGMKAGIGVDVESGLTRTIVTTAAKFSDITQNHALLNGKETIAFGEAGYQDVEKLEDNQGSDVTWLVALRSGKRRALPDSISGRLCERAVQIKASIRAKAKPLLQFVKSLSPLRKARYRGLARTRHNSSRCLA